MVRIIDMSKCAKVYVNECASRNPQFLRTLSRYAEPTLIDGNLLNHFADEIESSWTFYEDMENAFKNISGKTYIQSGIKARVLRNGTQNSRAIMLHGDREQVSNLIKILDKPQNGAQIIDVSELSGTR